MPINYFMPYEKSENVYIVDIGEDVLPFTKKSNNLNYRMQYVIHFVVKGKGHYKTQNSNFTTNNDLEENTAFAIYKQDRISYMSNENNPMHYFWIGFDGEESIKILQYIGFSNKNPVINIEKGEEIVNAFNKIFTALKKHDHYLALSEFYRLLSKLRKNNKSLHNNNNNNNTNYVIQAAIDYIQNNIEANIKIKDLAQELHVNRSYLSTAFKNIYGTSPHQYIQQQRLHRARLLLTTTTYTISEIASLLRFADIYTFSKQFKKHFKIPPLEYRNKYKKYSLTEKMNKDKKSKHNQPFR